LDNAIEEHYSTDLDEAGWRAEALRDRGKGEHAQDREEKGDIVPKHPGGDSERIEIGGNATRRLSLLLLVGHEHYRKRSGLSAL
jgi:hypothetical protein